MDLTWLITIASLIGTVANIYKKSWCFLIWLCTNTLWMIVDIRHGLYAQAVLFFVYILLSIWGLIQWRRDTKAQNLSKGEKIYVNSIIR